ncbi:hypothetical protein BTZ20_2064 [Rhodococcus sp. MTM3W5.2]|uniref:hypothetical protein n=1 Tax=Rhodococcus sp. MTM3W5.2 TaxID=1805827 RepID=UPI000979115D|nr:hypothetical protein [Rhodococcus sp. MTM3W5.2]AQA20793.1 hypothetical protein BTZ20_2064 [Rhodococcus sp. MTM3W5.2]
MAEDRIELTGELVEFGIGQREPGQPGEVGDLVTGDGRHRVGPFQVGDSDRPLA